jgi:threonine/homoserine/homoserine lactone efflux protein
MIELSTLIVFSVATFALFLSPGPNMAFVLTYGAAYGGKGGIAAALGIAAADVILAMLTATGVTAIVASWPPSLTIIRYIGVAYLLWLGLKAITSTNKLNIRKERQRSFAVIFRMGFFNCLLNPKALLFFMLFLPQFVVIERGNVALQLFVLGVILSFLGFGFHAILGVFSAAIQKVFAVNTIVAKYQGWFLGIVMFALALRLFLSDFAISKERT